MRETVYLSLGSNIGDRQGHLREALERLNGLARVTAVSPFYETEPVEFTEQEWFVNCAAAIETVQTPEWLMSALLELERQMGRVRFEKKGPRTIDLDILLFGERVVNTPGLTIPHPGMATRRFVLAPLAEIAPEARHPVLKKTIRQLLAELPAGQPIIRLP